MKEFADLCSPTSSYLISKYITSIFLIFQVTCRLCKFTCRNVWVFIRYQLDWNPSNNSYWLFSTAYFQHHVSRLDHQWCIMAKSRKGSRCQSDLSMEIGLGRTHPRESSIKRHSASIGINTLKDAMTAFKQRAMRHDERIKVMEQK